MGYAGKKIRLGIIGTGRIAARFVPEAKIIDAIEVACVYNPHLSGAEDFAKTHGITKVAGRMEEFLSEVDAAYIAGPHGTHVPYARQLLLEGKHVLCEKPMAFTAKEAEELFALAAEKGLVLMEAIKTAYCPGFRALVETVQSGAIGEVYDVEACFTKLSPSNVREVWDERYGGSFPELGAYSLLPVVKILGTGNQGIEFQSIPMGNGKDGYTKAIIRYPRGMAFAKTGLSVKSEGQLLVSGSRGYVLAEAPWWLTKKFEVRYEDPSRREVYEFPFEGAGLRYEIQAFTERILADGPGEAGETGKNNNDEGDATGVMPQEGIWIARQMEAFLASREKEYGACEAGTEHGTAQPGRNVSQCKSWSEGKVGIWAHRGCSMRYPENTLEAFEAAAAIKGLAGIELDVQLTKDGELVVIHDETVDRTTNGTGEVRSYTLSELKNLVIQGREGRTASIPTLEEVFRLLQPICKNEGLLINIELKNSNIRY